MSWLKKLLGIDDSERESAGILGSLRSIGINIVKDEKLATRLDVIEALYEQIMSDEYSSRPWERVNLLDRLIKLAAMAWGRAGNNRYFAEMVVHWEQLKALYLDLCNILNEADLDPTRRKELIDVLDNIAKRDVLPAGWVIVAVSFREEDVAPKYISVIQSSIIPIQTAPPEVKDVTSSILEKVFKGEKIE